VKAPRSESPVGRALAPLIGSLWTLFVIWSVLVAAVWTIGFGDVQLAEHVHDAGLRSALSWLLHALDAIWLTLAAVNVYLALVRAEGLATARRWSALALLAGLLISAASAFTRVPLGPIFYPPNLGMKLGPVPFALPLLWLVIVVGARDAAQVLLAVRAMAGLRYWLACSCS
jgi:uncharacterized membrane protein